MKKDNRTRFLSVRVTDSMKRDLKLVARAEGVSPSEVIRRALAERRDQVAAGVGAGSGEPQAVG